MNTHSVARAPVSALLSKLPSVDKVLSQPESAQWIERFGRQELLHALRVVLDQARKMIVDDRNEACLSALWLQQQIERVLNQRHRPNMRQVINLTGTVLHTNLGRAVMPAEVIEAMMLAASDPCALEYDLGEGKRGDRDEIVEEMLCELTGAESATVVNNNAAAVFLLLNALSARKETVVSRGELIEIGGAFRIPDIMKRAGAKLVEVGTTNRTHEKDFQEALTSKTALLMKVHTSNYVVQGFTAEVAEKKIAEIAHAHGVPFVVDLGSGTLIDLAQYGLPSEPTPRQAIEAGADLVTFSGDKLLGGPQAGIIVGRRDLIQKIKRNPLKRALRVGKITLAGLEAVLRLYRDPVTLPSKLTVLNLLTRPAEDMREQALRFIPQISPDLALYKLSVNCHDVKSQIGSGSLPVERLPSAALVISGLDRSGEKNVIRLERLLRSSDTPVIGRMNEKNLILDLRCLQPNREDLFLATMRVAVMGLAGRA